MKSIKYFVEIWIERKKEFISYNTYLIYMRAMAIIEGSKSLDLPVDKLSAYNIEIFFEELFSLYSSSTIKTCSLVLKAGFNIAKECGYINELPYWKVAGGSIKEKSALSKEETGIFLNLIKERSYGNVLTFQLFTGMRIGEATGLTWNCIDLEKNLINIIKAVQREKSGLTVGLPKNNKCRSIPINEVAKEIIYRQKNVYNKLCGNRGFYDKNLVFSTKSGKPYDTSFLNKKLKEISNDMEQYYAKNGIHKRFDISTHTLRHTYATHLMEKGVPLKIISELLGHSSIVTTADTYCHVSQEQKATAAEMFHVPTPL